MRKKGWGGGGEVGVHALVLVFEKRLVVMTIAMGMVVEPWGHGPEKDGSGRVRGGGGNLC